MIFYKRITICNLFAYYGEQSVDFENKEGKPLYLIYGNNGFGKTSFIRSMKLLFLGSGLENAEIPSAILSFVDKGRGRFVPKNFLLGGGENQWLGALNKKAYNESKNEYFVELLLEHNGSEIAIKRSWSIFPGLEESFTFSKNGEVFRDNEAKEMCEMLLPSQFVEFFIFDGEEIKTMADEISTELKSKIQNMLNISVLDTLQTQAKKIKEELTKQSFNNEQDKIRFDELKMGIDIKQRDKSLKQKELTELKSEISEWENEKNIKSQKRDKLIKNSGKEEEKIQNSITQAQTSIEKAKNDIKSSHEEILFVGLECFMDELCKSLAKISDVSNFSQEELEKLCDFSAEHLHENHHDISSATFARHLKDAFDKFLKFSSQDEIFGAISGLNKVEVIYNSTKTNQKHFGNAILAYKENSNELKEAQMRLEEALREQSIQDEIKANDDEITDLQIKIDGAKNKILSLEKLIIELDKDIADQELEIIHLEDQIKRDDRITEKIAISEILIDNFKNYKQERIKLVTKELKSKILDYYKKLIIDDNVCGVDIDEFSLSLKDASGETISVKNQSAGQKQAIAISIFWALSELSGRCLPLIIDTPLARIDGTNRANIIQNYYFNASKQIIVLPHDREFGQNEYRVAQEKIASIYKIKNDETRSSASIQNCDINEILGE